MSKHYHKKFVNYINYLLETKQRSVENISKKTGIAINDLKNCQEEDDIANKFEYEKLMEVFDPDKRHKNK